VKPVLFEILGWGVPTHEFFVGLGVAAAGAIYFFEARRRGLLTEQTAWVAVGALIGGAILAKAGSVWRFVGSGATLSELYVFGGRSLLGGLAGAYFGALIAKRLVGYRRSTGDLFAPAVAVGLAIGRIGCFLTEQIGTTTSLPWGVSVSLATAETIPNCPQCATGRPMHPSFLYEVAFHAVAFGLLWWNRDRLAIEGLSFKVYLLAYGLFRFGVEFVRGNPDLALGLSGSQVFLLVSLPILVVYLVRSARTERRPELSRIHP
jgi:prolipoprotein diacylglyceryltransferase